MEYGNDYLYLLVWYVCGSNFCDLLRHHMVLVLLVDKCFLMKERIIILVSIT
jgi:hypothetical protein